MSLKSESEGKVKVTQSCPTLCNPMDYTVHGILQARILEWVAFPPSPADLPNPGIEPRSPTLQADSLPAEPQERLLDIAKHPWFRMGWGSSACLRTHRLATSKLCDVYSKTG